MMQRVHAPEKRYYCQSRPPAPNSFDPRGFARREEKNMQTEVHRIPQGHTFADTSIIPPVQAKLSGGMGWEKQEADAASSEKWFDEDVGAAEPVQAKPEPNRTGMPDRLKAGIEALSGIDMSDVRVHANSPKPARLNALAYTHGNQIYMGPGQERHLPHEAWHAVQQRKGNVKLTSKVGGLQLNESKTLEAEADLMGTKAQHVGSVDALSNRKAILAVLSQRRTITSCQINKYFIQRLVKKKNELDHSDHVEGKMDYSFQWHAESPHHNGFIIQAINRDETTSEGKAANYSYWEAWKVLNGEIFNRDENLKNVQHDTWFQKDMPKSSHGIIHMKGSVYFSNVDSIQDMSFGGVNYAAGLLSSDKEPNVDKKLLFKHGYIFKYDRTLLGSNKRAVIERELKREIDVDPDLSWEDFDWEDFAEAVNDHDPNNKLKTEEIKQISNEILKSKHISSKGGALLSDEMI